MPLVADWYAILYAQRPGAAVFDDVMLREKAQDAGFVTGR
jgi:hypothetical protein